MSVPISINFGKCCEDFHENHLKCIPHYRMYAESQVTVTLTFIYTNVSNAVQVCWEYKQLVISILNPATWLSSKPFLGKIILSKSLGVSNKYSERKEYFKRKSFFCDEAFLTFVTDLTSRLFANAEKWEDTNRHLYRCYY